MTMPGCDREETAAMLAAADPTARIALLIQHSGLPGPRANLPLAEAYADIAIPAEAMRFIEGDDEYLALCGALAIAAHADDHASRDAAGRAAKDPRWRVREGVATGLQRLGATDPAALLVVLAAWRRDPHPLVQRARAAAICEPPMLKDPAIAAAARRCCAEATEVLRGVPVELRRRSDVRTLRQALGYCWSVAVAADPGPGLIAFAELERDTDSDIAWIVRANRGKRRLARLLSAGSAPDEQDSGSTATA